MCRDPQKVLYRSIRSAAQAVLEQYRQHGRSFEIYQCADHFHLTTAASPMTAEVLTRVEEAAK